MANKKFLDLTGTNYLWDKIVTALSGKADNDKVTALESKHAIGKTVAEEISDGITALDLSNTYAAKTIVDTLVGSDANKTVRTIANEELAAQLIAADADEALDTLQEIAAWIQDHPDEASAMNSDIQNLSSKLTLGTYEDNGEDVEYANVKLYVEAAIADLKLKAHIHDNKNILDNITLEKVTSWDNAVTTLANADTFVAITDTEIDSIVDGSD